MVTVGWLFGGGGRQAGERSGRVEGEDREDRREKMVKES